MWVVFPSILPWSSISSSNCPIAHRRPLFHWQRSEEKVHSWSYGMVETSGIISRTICHIISIEIRSTILQTSSVWHVAMLTCSHRCWADQCLSDHWKNDATSFDRWRRWSTAFCWHEDHRIRSYARPAFDPYLIPFPFWWILVHWGSWMWSS